MEKEELKRILDDCFSLTVNQVMERNSTGYRLQMRAFWSNPGVNVDGYIVQLTGINPLTGENVERDDIRAVFSFDNGVYLSRNVLNYHGRFRLRCSARIGREDILFREQDIRLEFSPRKPLLEYRKVKEEDGFALMEITGNCWKNCRGKVWIHTGGHEQRVNLPEGKDKTVRFYVKTDGPVTLTVEDDNVTVRKGR